MGKFRQSFVIIGAALSLSGTASGGIPPLLTVSCASLLSNLHQDKQTLVTQSPQGITQHSAFQALRALRRQVEAQEAAPDPKLQAALWDIEGLEQDLTELRQEQGDFKVEFALRSITGEAAIQEWLAQRPDREALMGDAPVSHRALYRHTLTLAGLILPLISAGDVAGRLTSLFHQGLQRGGAELASLIFAAGIGTYFVHRTAAFFGQRRWKDFEMQNPFSVVAMQTRVPLDAIHQLRRNKKLSGGQREYLHWAAVTHPLLARQLSSVHAVELLEQDPDPTQWKLHQVVSYRVTRDPPPPRGRGKRLRQLEPAPLPVGSESPG